MKVPFVDLKAQYLNIKTEIDTAVNKVIENTAFIGGVILKSFEKEFATFCSAKFCIGVGNGTDALWLALKGVGLKEGHEVIVPANSFIATSEAVTLAGGRVVFCDIDPRTFTLNVEHLERLINPQTKAIIPVHLYGHPADMNPILKLAQKWNVNIIEDAAQAHGAKYLGKPVGTLGEIGCFSFYPGKNLGAYGDAGAIITNNADMANTMRMMANHGREKKYDHLFEGLNSRLDTLQAAVLRTKLKYLEQWTTQRRENAQQYTRLLDNLPVLTPLESPDVKAVYHLYVIRVPDGRRDALRKLLSEKGISTGIHYPIALPNLKAYAYLNHKPDDFPFATRYSSEILSLPMYPELTHRKIEYVTDTIRQFFAKK